MATASLILIVKNEDSFQVHVRWKRLPGLDETIEKFKLAEENIP